MKKRKAIGILPYTYSGSNINNEYYTSTFSDSVGDDTITRTYTNNAVSDLTELKTNKISNAKSYANQLFLSDTDWYVVRNVETSTAIPSEITAFRTAVRTNYVYLKLQSQTQQMLVLFVLHFTLVDPPPDNSNGSITIDGTSSSIIKHICKFNHK